MKLLTMIFLASLLIVKGVLSSVFIYQAEIDLSFLEKNAIASEPQKDSKSIVAPAPNHKNPSEANGENVNNVMEEKIDLNFLIEKKAEIEKREEELVKKRAELMAIQEDINDKIARLTKLRNEIRTQMSIKKTVEEQKLKHIIKAYSAMKPQKAASLIEKMEISFAIELLSKMKGDVVGNILSFIETEKAVRMSEQLAKRK